MKNVMASLRCHGDSDCNKTPFIRNVYLYIIPLWQPFFHIFNHADVVNAQTGERLHTLFPRKEKYNEKLTLSERTVLCGWHKQSNNWELLSYCLIVAKYHIFATSVRDGILDFDSFPMHLNNEIVILRTIAFKTNHLGQFKKAWAKLL